MTPGASSCPVELGEDFPSLVPKGTSASLQEKEKRVGAGQSYNPVAALTLAPFARVADNLFARGTPYVIPLSAILVYLPVFFFLAAITAGCAIPSGLLLPKILIGALIGRAISIALLSVQWNMNWYTLNNPEN